MSEQIAVSVIICTYNRAADLEQTLGSLRDVALPSAGVAELIVVDNGSTDDTAKVAQSFSRTGLTIRYVREARRGKGHAYNAGIAAARGRVLLFSDDDMRFPPDWIEGMCAPIFAGEADAVAGGVKIAKHLERPWMQEMHRLFVGGETSSLTEQNFELQGGSMAVARSVLNKVPAIRSRARPRVAHRIVVGRRDSILVASAGGRLPHQATQGSVCRASFRSHPSATGRLRSACCLQWPQQSLSDVPLAARQDQMATASIFQSVAASEHVPSFHEGRILSTCRRYRIAGVRSRVRIALLQTISARAPAAAQLRATWSRQIEPVTHGISGDVQQGTCRDRLHRHGPGQTRLRDSRPRSVRVAAERSAARAYSAEG